MKLAPAPLSRAATTAPAQPHIARRRGTGQLLALLLALLLPLSGCGSDDIVSGGPSQVGSDGISGGDGSIDGSNGNDASAIDGSGDTSADSGQPDVADSGRGDDDTSADSQGEDSGSTDVPLDVVALTLTPAAISLPVGGQVMFVLDAKLGDGSSVDASALAQWTSTAPGVVAVAQGGQVTALAAGSAEIRAAWGGVVTSAKVSVVPAALVALEIQPQSTVLVVGATKQLGAVGTFADGSQQNLGLVVAWSSSAPAIAEIGADGTIVAKAAGTASITAKLGEVTATAAVSILGLQPTELVIEPVDPTLPLGASLKFSAIASFDDGSKADVSASASWASSAPDVVKIAKDGTITTLLSGSAIITADFAGLQAKRIVTVITPVLQTLTIDPTSATLSAGGTLQLKVVGTWQDGSSTDLTTSATFTATPQGVVSVSNAPGSQGKVLATAPGEAKVVASYGGKQAEATLTVSKATLQSLAISPAQPSVPKGVTVQLVALATLSDGSIEDVTEAVVWASSAPTIATVSSSGKTAGQASALAVGQTTITASLDGKVATVTLLVSAAALTGVEVGPATIALEVGGKAQLTATANYSDGAKVDVTASATWKSANTAVAEVANAAGSQGLVTAKAEGSTTITATIGGVSGKASVTVKAPSLTELQIGPINPQRKAGEQLQFFVTAVYSNGATQNVTFDADWKSSNTVVASVGNSNTGGGGPGGANQKGRCQAKTAGKAEISASFGGKTATTTLTVTDPELVALQISPAYWEMNAGTPMQLQAIAIFSDDSSQNVTFQAQWASSDGKIASVGNAGGGPGGGGPGGGGQPKGRILALTPGTVEISATFQGVVGKGTIVVKPAVPTGISLFPGTQSCAPGQFRQVEATLIYSDGSSLPITQAATFTSSAQAVAAALNGQGQKGFVQCLSPGKATIKASFQGYAAEVAIDVSAATLESIAIAPGAVTVAAGVPVPLQVSAYFSDGTSQPVNGQATLTTSDAKVAVVIDAGPLSGVVQTLAAGQATITAAYGGKKATATITVTAATVVEVQVTPASPAVAPGTWVKFEAVAVMSDNTVQQVTNLASWASSATSVAAVDNTPQGFGKGLCQAISAGTSTISATWGGKTGKSVLTVNAATLVEIQVTPFAATLPIGYLTLFKATGIYSDFTTQDLTPLASWSSSKTAVASVASTFGSKGQVTPLAAGTTDIVATYQGKAGKASIVVTDAKLQSIAISPASGSVGIGKTLALQATGTFAGGLKLDLTDYATWLTQPAGVVAISNAQGSKGQAFGLAKGETTVQAIRDGVTGTAKISVQ